MEKNSRLECAICTTKTVTQDFEDLGVEVISSELNVRGCDVIGSRIVTIGRDIFEVWDSF